MKLMLKYQLLEQKEEGKCLWCIMVVALKKFAIYSIIT
jgi:hypothetical protein